MREQLDLGVAAGKGVALDLATDLQK